MLINRIASLMGWPFTIIYIAIIIATAYITMIIVPKTLKNSFWLETPAKVINTQIVQNTRINRLSERVTFYSAQINYQYSIAGQTHHGQFKRWAERDRNSIAQRIEQQYPLETTITIYHNPNNPSQSVHQRGTTGGQYFALSLLVILLLAMTFTLYKNS